MRKKIGIATIALRKSSNYGNRLQTYALQEFLRQSGYDPLTIYYEADYVRKTVQQSGPSLGTRLRSQSLRQSMEDAIRILKRKCCAGKLEQLKRHRTEGFEAFAEQYIAYTEQCYYSDSDYTELNQKCGCFITGSDQVWNPYYEGSDAFSYLDFAGKGKRSAYAPSLGVEKLPSARKEQLGKWIRGIDHLSVREQAGRELLKREFGLDAKVVCDPVLLLDKERWHSIAHRPDGAKVYFAVYLLGKQTTEKKKIIRKLERKYGVPAVDLYAKDDPASAFATPLEFLGYLENAEFVVTDSFHGLAFSSIFERPIVVLPRYHADRLDSRLEDMLSAMGVTEHWEQFRENRYDVIRPDYDNCRAFMKARIEDSKQYLLSAIDQCLQDGK